MIIKAIKNATLHTHISEIQSFSVVFIPGSWWQFCVVVFYKYKVSIYVYSNIDFQSCHGYFNIPLKYGHRTNQYENGIC